MKVEILYPEITNIYGDSGNVMFLKEMFNDVILTTLNNEPYFVNNDVDFIYMGSHSDMYDKLIIEKLGKYKDRLMELIENNTVILFTGTSIELIGSYIEEKNRKIETLNLFPKIYFKRDKNNRFSSLFKGKYDNIDIVGNQSQFSFMYGENEYPFINAYDKCYGMNEESKIEGIHYKNFYATYLLGPFLILNPLFMKHLLKLMNCDKKLIFEEQLMKTYLNRLEILNQKDLVFISKEMERL